MSTVTIVNSTSNQFHADYDISKIFVFGNRYQQASFYNGTGSTASFAAGTVVGRMASTGKITICDSTATDGSQIPVGILKTAITDLAHEASTDANYCLKGDVVASKLIFSGEEALDTMVIPTVTIPEITITVPELTDSNTDTIATFDLTVAAQTLNVSTPKIYRDLIQSLGIILVESTELTGYDNQ